MNQEIRNILKKEEQRQKNSISLIASENITSIDVRDALSSVLTNKYAEGYPGRRYYSGCEFADEIEIYAQNLLKKIFNAKYANVQPHSGSQANQAVFLALLEPGDTILSLSLEAGGHLTHGAKINFTGKLYNIVHYTINQDGVIDMDEVEMHALKCNPKLIIAGASAYSRNWDLKRFREIANKTNAYFMFDMAHIAGIVAANLCENPVLYADVVTSTTHKTLRGPRGGIILSNNEEFCQKIDKALFPGIQGGPLMNTIAAKAVAFSEILDDSFKIYMKNVLRNAQILASKLIEGGGRIVSGGSDNHLMILDCQSFNMNAKEVEALLEKANISLSISALVGDSWLNPNGVRLGTPYISNFIEDLTEFSELLVRCLKIKDFLDLKNYVNNILNNN